MPSDGPTTVSNRLNSVIYYNARSVVNKLDLLNNELQNKKPDIFIISETWLNPSIPFSMRDYYVCRADRSNQIGGGVMIGCSVKLKTEIIEQVSLYCISVNNENTGLIAIYRPPNLDLENSNKVFEKLKELADLFNNVLIIGDLNLPDIDWINYFGRSCISYQFTDMCYTLSLHHMVCIPTRGNNILDLVLVSNQNLIANLEVGPPLGQSDHLGLNFQLITNDKTNDSINQRVMYNYGQADYNIINAYLMTIDWDEQLNQSDSIDEMWGIFMSFLSYIHENFIPIKNFDNTCRNSDATAKRLYRIKLKKWKKYQLEKTITSKFNFEVASATYNSYVQNKEITKEKALFLNAKYEPKKLFGYISNKLSLKTGISCIKNPNSEINEYDDYKIASLLAEQFERAFTLDDGIVPQVDPYSIRQPYEFKLCTPYDIIKIVRKMNQNGAPWPDEIPISLVKNCLANLALPISIIVNKSLAYGELPMHWKLANVTPVHKKGDKSNPGNYRPISVTSVFSKIAETYILHSIFEYISQNDLLSHNQHGFLPGKSTTTNLLQCLRDWCENFDMGYQTDVIYLDYSKAFDSVSHPKLILKLDKLYQIHPQIVKWIVSFLTNRLYRVKVNSAFSSWTNMISGVPQGSVLGPFLFLLYTNDINDIVHHSCLSQYADDTKIYNAIKSNMDQQDLQGDLHAISAWSDQWQLKLNAGKTLQLTLGLRSDRQYMINGESIQSCDEAKDLGILIHRDFSSHNHCTAIVRRANYSLRNMKNCFKGHNSEFYLKLFTTYVRPLLESASIVYSPYTIQDIDALESVQRRFTKYLPGLFDFSYQDRLTILGMESLELRRLRADLIHVYKMVREPNMAPQFFTFNVNNTRGHSYKLAKPYARTNVLKYYWSHRVVDVWNALPEFVVLANNLLAFRSELNKINLSAYCRGSTYH